MQFVKGMKLAAGVVLIVMGLHWIGQGTGLFTWPSNPEMDNHTVWAWFGLAWAVVGAGVVYQSVTRWRRANPS